MTQAANVVMPSWDLGTTNEDFDMDNGGDVYANITDPDNVGWFVMLTAISGSFEDLSNDNPYGGLISVQNTSNSNSVDIDPTGNIPDTQNTLSGTGGARINIYNHGLNPGCDVSFTLTLCSSTGSYLQSCIFYWPGQTVPYLIGTNPWKITVNSAIENIATLKDTCSKGWKLSTGDS